MTLNLSSDSLTLGVETSCDETAAAVLAGGRSILANHVATQDDLHAVFGGVVPEIASRRHTEVITRVVDQALNQAGVSLADIALIAATHGPGLVGSLLVGVSAAKGYAISAGLPLVGVNHLEGHVMSNFVAPPDQQPAAQSLFPSLCLIASGGHTDLILMREFGAYQIVGWTRDDAAGEALDKAARVMQLGYPGGPAIEKVALSGNPQAIDFPRPAIDNSLDFSFAGLKTALVRYVEEHGLQATEGGVVDVAASYQQAVVDTLVRNVRAGIKTFQVRQVMICGGVAANSTLRLAVKQLEKVFSLPVVFPPVELCTDNAAMIAAAGHFRALRRGADGLDLDVFSALPLAEHI